MLVPTQLAMLVPTQLAMLVHFLLHMLVLTQLAMLLPLLPIPMFCKFSNFLTNRYLHSRLKILSGTFTELTTILRTRTNSDNKCLY